MGKFAAFAVFIILIFLSSTVNALIVEYPRSLTLESDVKEFDVKITNDSEIEKSFAFEFINPAKTEILQIPETIKPHEEATIRLKVYNEKDFWNSTYFGKLKVALGLEELDKDIEIKFAKPVAQTQEKTETEIEKKSEAIATQLSGFVSFFDFTKGFSIMEIAIDGILVLFAVVLLIAFISRFVKRVRTKHQ